MPISKEENAIHKALLKSQMEIKKDISKINNKIKCHYKKHGVHGDGFLDDLKNFGNTIKSGFEDKIEHPIEDIGNQIKTGFQDNIINPVQEKVINPTQQLINSLPDKTKKLFDSVPESMKNDPKFQKALDYVTKKKGGLASSLLHNGLPSLTSALGGAAGTILAPELGMFGGIAGSTAGGYAGKELADYIGNKTGTGFDYYSKDYVGMKKAAEAGDVNAKTRISRFNTKERADYNKANGVPLPKEMQPYIPPNKTGTGLKKRGRPRKHHIHHSWEAEDIRPSNSALGQLLKAHRLSEEKELHKGQLDIARHLHEEMLAMRRGHKLNKIPLRGDGFQSDSDVSSDDDITPMHKIKSKSKKIGMGISNVSGRKFKKGSKEAKEHMAKIRAMKKGGKGLYP
jgi:hypothetical protein